MISKVILLGKLHSFSQTYTVDGSLVIKFTIVTWQGKGADYHNVTYFADNLQLGKFYVQAFTEIIERKKNGSEDTNGDYIYVEGRLSYRRVQTESGTTRRYVNIIAEKIRLVSSKKTTQNGDQTEQDQLPPNEITSTNTDIQDDDIPF